MTKTTPHAGRRAARNRAGLGLVALALLAGPLPSSAQNAAATQKAASSTAETEARMKKLEAEVRALQRQVFPGGSGKFFPPEIDKATSASPAAGTPATSAVTDLLARMDALESQITRLTAQTEENANRIAQVEAKVVALTPPPAPAPAPAVDAPTIEPSPVGTPELTSLPSPAAAPAVTPAPKPVAAQAPAGVPAAGPGPSAAQPAAQPAPAARPAVASAPSPAPKPTAAPAPAPKSRVDAVKAIEKPKTEDPGDDEYTYGFRLWDARFYPEATQQLQLFVEKNPKHWRLSYARNLIGRAFLDDGNPREAAQWFLRNYQADKDGARAADSLLYLAEAMRQIKDSSRACIALDEFAEKYPADAAGRLKSTYDATRAGVKCN